MSRNSTKKIMSFKNNKKIIMLTAYDALFANIFDDIADIILVGDSLNMSFAGQNDTLKDASLKQMIYHTKAVCRGSKKSMVIMDMPFGTYYSKKVALKNAIKAIRKTDALGVKIEGGADRANIVKHLCANSIPVMGHIGLLPQNSRLEGGYMIKGKTQLNEDELIRDAKSLELAGAFAIVCEGVIASVAKKITQSVNIPIIGIGSGADTDGQVLVWSDALGLFEDFTPKFVRKYLNGAELIKEALMKYKKDVNSGDFPSENESYI